MKLCPEYPKDSCEVKDERLRKMLERYAQVFRKDLPAGLPPTGDVDHEIKIHKNEKPPYRPIFLVSPAELKATKEYVVDLIKKGKIRPSKSPYGAPLFFVKQKKYVELLITED